MEEEILMFLLWDECEENWEKRIRRSELRYLRDINDPFTLPEVEFVKNFRLNKGLCQDLIASIRPYEDQKTSLSLQTRLLATLYFMGHGSYQKCVGNNCNLPMSQPSVSRSLRALAKLIIKVKGSEIRFPQSIEEENREKAGFYRSFGIKGTIGAIDCTHIALISPSSKDPERPLNMYMNRKGFYSINVEAVCDHRLVFTFLNAKFPGATHDSGIWATSDLREHLIRMQHNHRRESWLLGDQGYPVEPWLFTPLSEPITNKEKKYNKLHASARNTIERAFGVLKTRFRCLGKHRVLHYSHEVAADIITACAILHNIIIKAGVSSVEPLEENDSSEDLVVGSTSSQYNSEGDRMRKRYISQL